jgi:hypothetical protein
MVTDTARRQLPAIWRDVLYDARLVYNDTGDMVRPSSSPDYVGEPTPDLEQAWKEILPGTARDSAAVQQFSNRAKP